MSMPASRVFAPVPEPTIRTGVLVLILAVLMVTASWVGSVMSRRLSIHSGGAQAHRRYMTLGSLATRSSNVLR